MNKQKLFIGVILLLLASFLRLYQLDQLPPGILRDETLNADIATSIRQGEHALFFRQGYGHEPLYHYLATPFQIALGHNFLSIRLPSAFLSLLFLATTYSWFWNRFDRFMAISVTFLLATSWWAIVFARVGLRPIAAPFFIMLALQFWLRKPKLAGLFLGLSIYTYTAARVIFLLPLFFAAYTFLFPSSNSKLVMRKSLIIFLISFALYLPLAYTVTADPTLQERINQLDGPLDALKKGDPTPILTNSWHTARSFITQGDPLWSYSWPGQPIFHPFLAILFYLGVLIALYQSRQEPIKALILLTFLFGLIPTIVASPAPSVIRMIIALPFVYFFPILTIDSIGKKWAVPPKWLYSLTALLLLTQMSISLFTGFVRWPHAPEVRLKYQTIWLNISADWQNRATTNNTLIVNDSWFEPVKADSLQNDYGHPLKARWTQKGEALIYPATDQTYLYVPEFAPLHPSLFQLASFAPPIYREPTFPSYTLYQMPPSPIPIKEETVTFKMVGGETAVLTLLNFIQLPQTDPLKIELVSYWELNSLPPADLSLFVHLLDENEQLRTQHDGLDALPARLQPQDRWIQLHTLILPSDSTNNNPITFALGVYQRNNGERLIPSIPVPQPMP